MQKQNNSTYVNLSCSLFIWCKFVLLCLKAALEVCFCSRSCFILLKWLESVLTLSSKIAKLSNKHDVRLCHNNTHSDLLGWH